MLCGALSSRGIQDPASLNQGFGLRERMHTGREMDLRSKCIPVKDLVILSDWLKERMRPRRDLTIRMQGASAQETSAHLQNVGDRATQGASAYLSRLDHQKEKQRLQRKKAQIIRVTQGASAQETSAHLHNVGDRVE